MIRYAKQKTYEKPTLFRLTDWYHPTKYVKARVKALLRGQARDKKIGETKTKPPRTPRSAF